MTPPSSFNRTAAELVDAANEICDVRDRFLLTGRKYVVLVGGRGMGRHSAHAATRLGARVVVADADGEGAREVAAQIGDAAEPRVVDVTDVTDVTELATLAAGVGEADGVVDVIGIAQYKPVLDLRDGEWAPAHDLALRHAWLTLRHSGPVLVRRGAGTLTPATSVSGLGAVEAGES